MSTSSHGAGADDGPPRSKTTLFCPECGHASLRDGDWRVRTRDDESVLACPVCGTAIATRPRAESARRC